MLPKRILGAFIAFIIGFSICSFKTETSAATEYNFSERIVYGGTAVDADDYIYFANPDDEMMLYRRQNGSENSELIYSTPVCYLNYLNNRIYFISDRKIISIAMNGKEECIFYNSSKVISHLYAANDYLYYLCESEVFRINKGNVESVFAADGMCAFLPLSQNQFRWYIPNPDYIETDQTSDEIYTETAEKYLTYIYNTKTDENMIQSPVVTETAAAGTAYTDPYVNIGNVTLPLGEYMPGSFFSKNGQACTCHNDPNIDCIESLGGCNCMRYWPTGIKSTCEVDLLGTQCFGFARLVFYKCFGFIDHSYYNPGKFYNVGSIAAGAVTESTVKELLLKANTGAHVRLTKGHSVSILTMDENYIIIYHGNAGGDGVVAQPCIVSTRRFTWAQFAAYAAAGISFVNMPTVYPDNVKVVQEQKIPGYYQLNSNLNVRTGAATTFSAVGTVPNESYVTVLEVRDGWGRIEYNGSSECWICLDYATFNTLAAITPSDTSLFKTDKDNHLLIGKYEMTDFSAFAKSFADQNLTAYDRNGNQIPADGYISTGSVIKIEVNNTVLDSMTVVFRGDANGNAVIDIADYLIVKRIFLGSYSAENAYRIAADMNEDTIIDAKDYLFLKRYLTGANNL